jgi:hypothetical protein
MRARAPGLLVGRGDRQFAITGHKRASNLSLGLSSGLVMKTPQAPGASSDPSLAAGQSRRLAVSFLISA